MSGENTALVLEFISAWNRNDVDAVMKFFSPDCIYHNIPMVPLHGTAAIRKGIEGFCGMSEEIEWVVHQVAENEAGVVLTERTDRFKIAGHWVEVPVMGSFEVHDGAIIAWRDYFDLQQFQSQVPKAGAGGD